MSSRLPVLQPCTNSQLLLQACLVDGKGGRSFDLSCWVLVELALFLHNKHQGDIEHAINIVCLFVQPAIDKIILGARRK